MRNIWEEKYKKLGFKSQREYPNESLIAFIKSLNTERAKILELGCGSGANLWFLAKEGFKAYGIDFSRAGIKYCQQMLKKYNVIANLKLGDIKRLPYKNNFFDLIVDVVSVQHLKFKEHTPCLEEAFRCLKKGGNFFSYHLGENSISYKQGGGKLIDKNTIDNIRDAKKPLYNNGQTCFLSANDAYNLLKKIGFQNIIIDKVTRTYNNQEYSVEYLVIKAEK